VPVTDAPAEGAGARRCPPHPHPALHRRRPALEPGHLIMTGALHAAVPMTPGDVSRAESDRLGPVTVRVT
jgi:hypothetical protein